MGELFEEINKPASMKFLSKNAEVIETKVDWIGHLKGYNGFPDGKIMESGSSV